MTARQIFIRVRALPLFLIPFVLSTVFTQFAFATVSIPTVSSLTSFLDLSSTISEVANPLITTIGLVMDHRPYEPATPLGTAIGLDLGVEATLVQPPSSLGTALGTLSGSGSSVQIPILPSATFHLQKGITPFLDVGVSYLPAVSSLPYIGQSYFFGADVKICILQPEEGPTISIRLSYELNSFNVQYNPGSTLVSSMQVAINTTTFSPQIIMSKKLGFADPYIGAGYQYAYGSMGATINFANQPAPAPVVPAYSLGGNGSGGGGVFFSGISMKIPNFGFRITLEGAYSTAQANYLGTKIGFGF